MCISPRGSPDSRCVFSFRTTADPSSRHLLPALRASCSPQTSVAAQFELLNGKRAHHTPLVLRLSRSPSRALCTRQLTMMAVGVPMRTLGIQLVGARVLRARAGAGGMSLSSVPRKIASDLPALSQTGSMPQLLPQLRQKVTIRRHAGSVQVRRMGTLINRMFALVSTLQELSETSPVTNSHHSAQARLICSSQAESGATLGACDHTVRNSLQEARLPRRPPAILRPHQSKRNVRAPICVPLRFMAAAFNLLVATFCQCPRRPSPARATPAAPRPCPAALRGSL